MVEEGQNLSELPDIGDDLAEKIAVILDTGTLPLLEDLEDEINPAMADQMEIPGLGPNRVRMLHEVVGVSTVDELKAAAEAGKIRTVEGFGGKDRAEYSGWTHGGGQGEAVAPVPGRAGGFLSR